MVNGAPGSAWASLRQGSGTDAAELMILGTPADDDVEPLSADHLFDLASLTKIFTTVVALRLVEDGVLALDGPVAEIARVGVGEGSERITLRHLLTHSSGLPAEAGAWRSGLAGEELRAAVLRSRVRTAPGEAHRYSDVGFIAVGEIVERASGRPLAELVSETARLLGAASLTWRPGAEQAVATEVQPHRGLVRGEVHDELAHALGRPAGHAGLFGSVHDVAALVRMVRDGGRGEIGPVLSPESVALMTTPTVRADGWDQAIGLRVRDTAWMGDLDAAGHTGFTGTAFAVVPATGAYGVLLTNRVHPTREDTDVSGIRRDFFTPLA
ncbi:serine hydrolase domain-containing protein [Microbacterium sp. 179-I 3D4 NHS]|uniref:serine hydrolase domain-containing protein n=1 Tax=Microbacterium sp. 179-I 3D4 NHS TaxID=3142381 RepID=UPI0039A1ACAC